MTRRHRRLLGFADSLQPRENIESASAKMPDSLKASLTSFQMRSATQEAFNVGVAACRTSSFARCASACSIFVAQMGVLSPTPLAEVFHLHDFG